MNVLRLTVKLLLAASLLSAVGCAGSVSIWANVDNTGQYTNASPHHVHAGETAKFRITVTPDSADYVVASLNGEMLVLPKVAPGQFAFSRKFRQSWRDKTLRVRARAYRQVGRRDFIERRGSVTRTRTQGDQPDQLVGSSSMAVVCYQSKISIRLDTSGGAPDMSNAQLEIYGPDKKVTRVMFGEPGHVGFVVLGPTAIGNDYVIFYEPQHHQVRQSGRTRVVLKDPGKGIAREVSINTP